MLPLSRPVMATVGKLTFFASWNDFIGPLLCLQTDAKKTIVTGLATFLGLYPAKLGIANGGAATVTVPALLLFPIGTEIF